MGHNFADQYSFLHFSVGVVVYFWKLPLGWWFLVHSLFEFLENTDVGIRFINNLPLWPGGKPGADSMINILGDTTFAMLGWIVAYSIDKMGHRLEWYKSHL